MEIFLLYVIVMNMKNKYILIIIIILFTSFIVGGLWFLNREPYVNLENPFVISSLDIVESWEFQAPYKDGGELEKRAFSEITRLKELFREDEFTDYTLYVSIAAQYDLLGEGKKEFEYLGYALASDVENTTGLAWHNMGKLMTRLGANESARIAFNNAVEAQPLPVYYMSMIEFLEEFFPDDKTAIDEAKKAIGIL